MGSGFNSFDQSALGGFVESPFGARNGVEDFVLGGDADLMLTFKDAILPDRKVVFSALIKNGVLSQFGKFNEDFVNLTALAPELIKFSIENRLTSKPKWIILIIEA